MMERLYNQSGQSLRSWKIYPDRWIHTDTAANIRWNGKENGLRWQREWWRPTSKKCATKMPRPSVRNKHAIIEIETKCSFVWVSPLMSSHAQAPRSLASISMASCFLEMCGRRNKPVWRVYFKRQMTPHNIEARLRGRPSTYLRAL